MRKTATTFILTLSFLFSLCWFTIASENPEPAIDTLPLSAGLHFNDAWISDSGQFLAIGFPSVFATFDVESLQYFSTRFAKENVNLGAIWAKNENDVFAADIFGGAYRFNNGFWFKSLRIDKGISAIWGTSPTDVFAGGESGVVFHFNGETWSKMDSGTNHRIIDIWGCSSSNVLALTQREILRYDGTAWQTIALPFNAGGLRGISGSSCSDVWVATVQGDPDCCSGEMLHFDGENWLQVPTTSRDRHVDVIATPTNDVYVLTMQVTESSWQYSIVHYDGKEWSSPNDLPKGFFADRLAASRSGEVFAVGCFGEYRYGGRGCDNGGIIRLQF